MKKTIVKKMVWTICIFFLLSLPVYGSSEVPETLPVKDTVTMIDLGAHKCIPCKMMAPIIAKLKKEYEGRAAIVFLDVWEDPAPAKKYGIRGIPTQIFFDKAGKEVFRHTGFMDEKSIVAMLQKLGVE